MNKPDKYKASKRRFLKMALVAALILNMLVSGAYAIMFIHDHIRYDAYRNASFFAHLAWVIGLPLVTIFSLMGLFKIKWAAILSCLAGLCFFLWMTYGFIDWHFDPMEQGRNGGVLYLALLMACFAGLNVIAITVLIKRRRIEKGK